jgi:hypothetical protein
MHGCGCWQNQTPKKALEALGLAEDKGQPTKGWGLFVVPDPEAGPLKIKGIMVDNLEYAECCDRGELCLIFKWIHPSLMTFAAAQAEVQSLKTKLAGKSGLLVRCPGSQMCNDASADCDSVVCICYQHRCHLPF